MAQSVTSSVAYLNDDVLLATLHVLAKEDLLSCRMVCRHWCNLVQSCITEISWRLTAEEAVDLSALKSLVDSCYSCSHMTIHFPKNHLLSRQHFHAAVSTLVHLAPSVTSITVKGPEVIQFTSAPSLEIEKCLVDRQHSASEPLRALRFSGHFANSVYLQLHAALPVIGEHLRELRICGCHPWSRVLNAAQMRALPMLAPLLVVLEIPAMFAEEGTSLAPWCAALSEMSCLKGLRELSIDGPFFHIPQLAAVVASWAAISSLRKLQLELSELTVGFQELDMYGDPDMFQATIWTGVLPKLTQLTSLSLKLDDLPQDLWLDLASCSWLDQLDVTHIAWALNFDISQGFSLHGLKSLNLCLGDADLSVLGSLHSLRSNLKHLSLDLKGMQYMYAWLTSDDKLSGLQALSVLRALRSFRCTSKSLSLQEEDVKILAKSWSTLESFHFDGPIKLSSGAAGFSMLLHLRTLSLINQRSRYSNVTLDVAHLPASLQCLTAVEARLMTSDPTRDAEHTAPLSLHSVSLSMCILTSGNVLDVLLTSGTLRQLHLNQLIREVGVPQIFPYVIEYCPLLTHLRLNHQDGFSSSLAVPQDLDLELMVARLERSLQEVQMVLGAAVTARGLCLLTGLRGITSLDISLSSVDLASHITCLTRLTGLQYLSVKTRDQNQSVLGRCAALDSLHSKLRASLPNCLMPPTFM